MEAKLDSDGSLKLTANSGCEAYALDKWLKDFSDNNVTIAIDITSYTNTNSVGYNYGAPSKTTLGHTELK